MINPIEGGRIEEIQGLKCWVPPEPKEISGIHLPKKDQKFIRTEVPTFHQSEIEIVSGTNYPEAYRLNWDEARREELIHITGIDPWALRGGTKVKVIYENFDEFYSEPLLEAFRCQEYARVRDGYWFMNNGIPVYITGDYYFYLNYWKLNTGYPQYRNTDRKLFYFWEYVKNDPFCYGLLEITKRGQGKSFRMGCVAYLRTIQYRGGQVGIQSKTDDDAENFFLTKVAEPVKTLPEFWVPVNNHGTEPTTGLYFFPKAFTSASARYAKKIDAIRSFMDFRASTELAYDSTTLKFLVQDEVAKLDPSIADAQKRLGKNRDCVYRDSKMLGKIWCSSTVEEMKKGGEQAKVIWAQSDINDRSSNGITQSGLYPFFLSALECTYFDEYGNPEIVKAKKFHDGERLKKMNDPVEYVGYVQRNPYTIEEAFMTDSEGCLYNAHILQQRQRFCLEFKQTTKGDFVWKDGVRDSKPEWVVNEENGKWEISWLFPFDKDSGNVSMNIGINGFKSWGPKNDHKFAFAYDPFSHGKTSSEKRRSKAGAAIWRKFDFWDQDFSDTFIADYVARPSDPNEAHEDMIIACVYFSTSILAENQKNSVVDYFKRRGYYDFIMWRPEHTLTTSSRPTEGIPSSEPVIDQYISTMQSCVQNKGFKFRHLRIITDLLKFAPEKRFKYDLGVACQICLLAADRPLSDSGEEDNDDSFSVEAFA